MQFIEKMMEERNIGREEGRAEVLAEGRAEGLAEGRAEISALTLYLLTQKRYDDLEKASRDESYLETILDEMRATQSQMQNSCDSIDQ